ncbi:MAG: ostA-like family protein [Alphaproteobacteria bacterium]|nr:ostA-like family protein [Alphaproteobacteria bacterium]
MIKTRTPFILTVLLFITAPALAQDTAPKSAAPTAAKPPLEITADDTLEWYRAEQKLIAKGNARASQETSSIEAQTLSANYREDASGRFEISQMNADKNVIIRTQSSTAYGDNAVYNLDKSLAVMTGDNLRMISTDQNVTAKDRFEYYITDGKLLAIGDAVATRPNKNGGNDKLRADTISAIFKENADGERVLETLEAKGNVIITTPTEKITGAYGIYRASTNKAEIQGGVTITRGPNTLQGQRAEVDMNTNKSRIFGGGSANNGRVKAVFYPGSDE